MTRAVILAAGFGSRLMPHTADRPKGMVELCGRPMLMRQIETLTCAGIEDVTIVGGYRAERLETLNIPVVMNDEYDSTNMVVSLFRARALMDGTRDIVIGYGDIVYEPRVLAAALYGEGDVVVVADREWRRLWNARMDIPDADVESFVVDSDDRLVEVGKRPETLDDVQGQYIGLLKVPAHAQRALLEAYDALDRRKSYDGRSFDQMYLTSFIQGLIESGWDVRPAWIDGGWLEVDTTEDLSRYEALASSGELDTICALQPHDIQGMRDLALHAAGFLHEPTSALLEACAAGVIGDGEIAALDQLARQIEIRGRLSIPAATIDGVLAAFMLANRYTGDLRHLNTVLKALDGTLLEPRPVRASILRRWCDNAFV